MKYKMREIDITKQDIRCCDDIDINERHAVNIVWELWFEVDKYFGTNTANSDSWVNFYTEWNYDTNDITAIVCIDYPDRTEEKYWELTDYEKDFFNKKMDEYCIKLTGMNMKSLYENEMEEY